MCTMATKALIFDGVKYCLPPSLPLQHGTCTALRQTLPFWEHFLQRPVLLWKHPVERFEFYFPSGESQLRTHVSEGTQRDCGRCWRWRCQRISQQNWAEGESTSSEGAQPHFCLLLREKHQVTDSTSTSAKQSHLTAKLSSPIAYSPQRGAPKSVVWPPSGVHLTAVFLPGASLPSDLATLEVRYFLISSSIN